MPNIELVSFFIILSSLAYGWQTMWAVAVFVLTQGMIYGFTPSWWIGYGILWPGLCAISIWLRGLLMKGKMIRALFSGAFGLCFGLLYAVGNIPFMGIYGAVGYWISGLPFDALHMLGNYFLMLVLGERMMELMMRQRDRGIVP